MRCQNCKDEKTASESEGGFLFWGLASVGSRLKSVIVAHSSKLAWKSRRKPQLSSIKVPPRAAILIWGGYSLRVQLPAPSGQSRETVDTCQDERPLHITRDHRRAQYHSHPYTHAYTHNHKTRPKTSSSEASFKPYLVLLLGMRGVLVG